MEYPSHPGDALDRDHRRLGQELELFAFSAQVGRGLPLWLPDGTVLREELEAWATETERREGYRRVVTPHITRAALYELSGHLPYFAGDLYPPLEADGDRYYLRAMNCPHHHMVFKTRPRTYRELPLRLAEYGTVYRYEKSGQLHGLLRARGFAQNDAHVYCTRDQAKEEFRGVMRLHASYYDVLGIHDYRVVLALRDPDNAAKYHGDEAMWAEAERITREALDGSRLSFLEESGGAAHYGPKVDFLIRSATGREYAISTAQLDLYMPERFDLTYVGAGGNRERPVVIHRAPLGSHERFIGFLVEHYRGAFPAWLAPMQVLVVPVGAGSRDHAASVAARLEESRIRVGVDETDDTVAARIRNAEMRKVPYVAVVGHREAAADTVSIRARGGTDLGVMTVDAFLVHVEHVVRSKSLDLAGRPGPPGAE